MFSLLTAGKLYCVFRYSLLCIEYVFTIHVFRIY